MRRRRVGLLGGSFNPAHDGHIHLSEQAIQALDLTELWWLVAPSNPFKDASTLAPYEGRLNGAVALTEHHPRIRVSDIEAEIKSYRTVTTLRYLQRRYPEIEFVWIGGMDLVAKLHTWRESDEILDRVPIAFFERPPLHQGTRRALAMINPHIKVVRNARTGPKRLKAPQIMMFRRRHTVDLSATTLRGRSEHARTKPE